MSNTDNEQPPETPPPVYGVDQLSLEEVSDLSARLGADEDDGPYLQLSSEIRAFITRDPVKGGALLLHLANEGDTSGREIVAAHVDELTRYDPKLGIDLWTRMIREGDAVSREAIGSIERTYEQPGFPVRYLGWLAEHFAWELRYEATGEEPPL